MKDSFFRSMTWLHTWVGLLTCWVLFLVFFAGTAAYYRAEINLWMQPENHGSQYDAHADNQQLILKGLTALAQQAPDAETWWVYLPTQRTPLLTYAWSEPAAEGQRFGDYHQGFINPATGEALPKARESRGGDFLYRLHFDLYYMSVITARWIVGFCTMFMLVAIISGIVIHKRIFKDFFSFRPGKGPRSWLDAHVASSVLALPFHLMITYTGLVTLMFMYMPWGLNTQYGDETQAFYSQWKPIYSSSVPSGEAATMQSPQQLLASLNAAMPMSDEAASPIEMLQVEHLNDANARVTVRMSPDHSLNQQAPWYRFSAVTGKLTEESTATSAANKTQSTMIALHSGRFAGQGLRLLYLLAGMTGCVMIATGAIMWAEKLVQKQQKSGQFKPGLALVKMLNLATFAGLPIALASYFYANRLLPVTFVDRENWEIHCFFISWALVALLACFKRDKQTWQRLFLLTALLYGLLPLLNAMTSQYQLMSNLQRQAYVLAGFDLMMLALAALFYMAAKRLRSSQKVRAAQVTKATAELGIES
ncbi:PepSY-associated TM helix domain-containing protein [Shewanella baltica OS625]|uniref:PepSY-associated TM helix domain protein n=1 Tax=Shewanella baltica (strain OS195) TaxID=399599 RepID=A9KW14_SHEB9|nr:PepSY-associated TM helix domain-containing protein [Shewanella baltica]ABX51588.1 PepSY-associated TM helix domain protein [Shewanella baltica OS195]ADT96583.1 PepSY-associated TM helix domain-containing protein [Shewanella baltica OS678]EHC07409.1 PepSY-associated TM helix domain-containing protein [Shewanella baltica OS625]